MVILCLFSSIGGEPDDMRRQIMIILHIFAIRRQSCPMAHKDKLCSLCAFCHLEAASPMTCRDKLWSFCTFSPSGDDRVRWHAETNYGHSAPFRHPEMIESEGTHRQIMVILDHLSFRGGEPDDMRRQIMVIPHLLPSRYDRVRWHAETNYGHSAPFVIQRRRAR